MAKRFTAVLVMLVLLLSCAVCAHGEEPAPIPVLSEEEIEKTPKGIHHYMLICMDQWDGKKHFDTFSPGHTDGLILVTVDEYAGRVMLTSFIRDMLIMRPDGDYGRINNILSFFNKDENGKYSGRRGIEALIGVINSHFNLRIEDYIVVDFKQVENIVNAVGGVDIKVTAGEAQYLKNYPLPASATTPVLSGAGTYHFTGNAAVIYMRIRRVATAEYLHTDGTVRKDTQDVGRTYRARTVLTSIADSLKDITYDDATKLLDVVVENTVTTNMSGNDMLDALDLAMELKGTPIESIRMPIDGTYEPMPVAGMATQQIDFIKNREALWNFLLDPFTIVEDEE